MDGLRTKKGFGPESSTRVYMPGSFVAARTPKTGSVQITYSAAKKKQKQSMVSSCPLQDSNSSVSYRI